MAQEALECSRCTAFRKDSGRTHARNLLPTTPQHRRKEQLMTPEKALREFHDRFGLVISCSPIDFLHENDNSDDEKLFALRAALNHEEWREFQKAWEGEDLIELADAICDL